MKISLRFVFILWMTAGLVHAEDLDSLKIFDNNKWWLEALSQSKISDEIFISDNSSPPKYWKLSSVKSTELKEWSQFMQNCQEKLFNDAESRKQKLKEQELLENNKNTALEELIRKRKELKDANELVTKQTRECQSFIEKILSILEARSQGALLEVHPKLGPKTFKKEDLLLTLTESQRNLASYLIKITIFPVNRGY